MRIFVRAALVAAAFGCAGAASAQTAPAKGDLHRASPGDIYFHKAGATWADHTVDMRQCFADARAFHQARDNSYDYYKPGTFSDNLANELGSGLGKAAAGAMLDHAARPANIENCMVAHGWEVVRTSKRLDRDKPQVLAEALSPLVGAASVDGEVVRAFANEAANAETVIYKPTMPFTTQSLSFVAFDAEETIRRQTEKPAAAKPMATRPSPDPVLSLTPDKLGSVGPSEGIVVVRFNGKASRSITFTRQGPAGAAPSDGKPDAFRAQARGKAKDPVVVFVLPPGRWALSAIDSGATLNLAAVFCYGAPGFDLRAGEVVFAGAFDSKGSRNLPDMDLTGAKQTLAADKPDLAEKLQAAHYVNGHRLSCGGTGYGYALELPDASFVDGYDLGSKAKTAKAAQKTDQAAAPPAAG